MEKHGIEFEVHSLKKEFFELREQFTTFYNQSRIDMIQFNKSFFEHQKMFFENLRSEVMKSIVIETEEKNAKSLESLEGVITYIAKREKKIYEILDLIKNDNNKQINLSFSVDGYDLIKKEKDDEKDTPNQCIDKLLQTLSEREGIVLKHRFGLLGETKKSLKKLEDILNISSERVRQIELKALRKCRHPARKKYFENIHHLGLRSAVFGYDGVLSAKSTSEDCLS